MSVNQAIWRRAFPRDAFPGLPCPHCATGKMKLVKESLKVIEPAYSKAAHKDEDWDPDWVTERWDAQLTCDEKPCGEIVFMAGYTDWLESEWTEEEGWAGAVQQVLRANSVFPACPLFRVPKEVPWDVRRQMDLAFQLFWASNAASIGRLRTSVELMLDDQKVPKEVLSKKGKVVRLDLAARIEKFEAMTTDGSASDSLHALRNIGNLGVHGAEVTNEALFDAFDVFEDVLLGVYEKKSIVLKVKKLNDTKGKY